MVFVLGWKLWITLPTNFVLLLLLLLLCAVVPTLAFCIGE